MLVCVVCSETYFIEEITCELRSQECNYSDGWDKLTQDIVKAMW